MWQTQCCLVALATTWETSPKTQRPGIGPSSVMKNTGLGKKSDRYQIEYRGEKRFEVRRGGGVELELTKMGRSRWHCAEFNEKSNFKTTHT